MVLLHNGGFTNGCSIKQCLQLLRFGLQIVGANQLSNDQTESNPALGLLPIALRPFAADFPSQRIEPKLKGRSILRDKSVAYSQLWRRSGTLAWPARATTSPKAARNLRSAIKIDLRTQFHRVFFIATTRQSTSSLINMDIGPFDPPPPLP